jgi:hypothetical protein
MNITRNGRLTTDSITAEQFTGNVDSNNITVDHLESNNIFNEHVIDTSTVQLQSSLEAPQGYVKEYTGNNLTLTHTLTGNVIRANTLTIGQADGGEGITVDGHIESDTFQAREQLYTPQGYVEDYKGNNITLTHTLTGNVIQANTLTIGQADGGEGITVDGHIESDTFQAREQLYTPQGYVEDYKGNNITLTHTLTGNVIQANTITIGQADGSEGITVDGHIESDTFQAREQLYTPQGYVEDYKGNNLTLTHTLTGNVIQANTITIGQADGSEGITVDGHIESDTFQAREQLYTPQGYVEDYKGNNITLTHTLTGNVIQANTITIGQADGGEGITVDGHIESDTYQAREQLYTPQGYVEDYKGNNITLTHTLTGNVIQANTITIGQADGGEGITVDGHIESDTYQAREQLYTPQGYVEDYKGNNLTLTHTLTGNVIQANTITIGQADGSEGITVDGHIESDTYQAREQLYTPQGYVEDYKGNNLTLTHTLTGNVIQANTITIGQADGGEGITVDGHIESDTYQAREQLYTPQGYVEDYKGNNLTLTHTLTGNVIQANTISADQSITTEGNIHASDLTLSDTLTGNVIQANDLTVDTFVKFKGVTETADMVSNVITADRLIVLNQEEAGISGTFDARADVLSGMVVDGDFNQLGGVMYGDGRGLSGFSGKMNQDLEARLRLFAESPHRLYVSTTGSDTNRGNSPDQAFRTIKKALSVSKRLTTVFVSSGEYTEANPMYVPEQVSIVGDSLRNVIIYALDPQSDIFHVDSMTYFTGLRFVDLRSPGVGLAFPAAISEKVDITRDNPTADPPVYEGQISAGSEQNLISVLPIKYSPKGYYSLRLPGSANIIRDEVVTKRGDIDPTKIQAEIKSNSTLVTLEYTGSEAFDVTKLFDTVSIRNSVVPSQAFIIIDKVQYQIVSLNSSKSFSINDYYRGDAKLEQFDFGSSRWAPQYPATLPANPPLDTITDVITDMTEAFVRGIDTSRGTQTWPDLTDTSKYSGIVPMTHAASLLVANKEFIQAETMAWIAENITISFDQDKCRRDVGYIVTAWANDIASLDTTMSEDYASYYENGAVIGSAQIQPTVQSIVKCRDIAITVARGETWLDSRQREVSQTFSTSHPESTLVYDPYMLKTFTLPGTGPASTRQFRIVASDQAVGYSADNMFNFNEEDRTTASIPYQSATPYRNFNGAEDAADTYIDVEFPYPTMIVGYSLTDHNLKKWRLLARETPYTDWTLIDGTRDIPRPTDYSSIQSAIDGLVLLLTSEIKLSNTSAYPGATPLSDAAKKPIIERDTGYEDAAEVIVTNRAFIQEEVMLWIDDQIAQGTQGFTKTMMTEAQHVKCKRDVGFIVDAIANDLMTGGADMMTDYTKYYLKGAILPDTQTQATVESMEYAAFLALQCGSRTRITQPYQSAIPQSYVRTPLNVNVTPRVYRTTAETKYTYYRLELLQNTDDSVFKIQSLRLHEFYVPQTLCDGPAKGDSIIGRIDVFDGGSGYTSAPTVTIKHLNYVNGVTPLEFAEAEAQVGVGGVVTGITLKQKDTKRLERVEIDNPGEGYKESPAVTITSTTGSGARAKAFIDKDGKVTEIIITRKGSGYDDIGIEIADTGTTRATAIAYTTSPDILKRGLGYYTGSDSAEGQGAIVEITAPPSGGTQAVAIAVMEDDYCTLQCPIFRDGTGEVNLDVEGRLKEILITNHGTGYSTQDTQVGLNIQPLKIPPTISIQPPLQKQPAITGSPYCQNSSNISGPWTTDGLKIPPTVPLPFDLNDVFGDGGGKVLDAYGSGGGCRIDGNCCAAYSPLRSMVMDAYTQVAQGSIGFTLTNFAYAQFVSTFSTFSAIHFLTLEGSFCNASNSVTDFGLRGLVSRGKARLPYLSGKAVHPLHESDKAELGPGSYDYRSRLKTNQFVETVGYRSYINEIVVTESGAGYSSSPTPTVTITPSVPGATGAQDAVAQIDASGIDEKTNGVTDISIIEDPVDNEENDVVGYTGGMGYKIEPTIDITTDGNPPSTPAKARAVLSGLRRFRVQITDTSQRPNNPKPDVTSLARINGKYYTVESVSIVLDTNGDEVVEDPNGDPAIYWDIELAGSIGNGSLPSYIDLEGDVEFFQVSFISTGSHVFEYSGSVDQSGCSYNSLPQFGGQVPNPPDRYHIVEQNRGRVTYTSSDHLGVFRVGKNFSIDQTSGQITFDLSNSELDLTGLEQISFKRGTPLNEFSDNAGLIGSQGRPGTTVAPSQNAIVQYMNDKKVPKVTTSQRPGFTLQVQDPILGTYDWGQLSLDTIGVTQAVIRADVVNGLVADGDAKVVGNLKVLTGDDTTVTVESAEGNNSRVDIVGEKSGSSTSTMYVGPTLEEGGGLMANTDTTMLFTQSSGQDTWTAKNDHGSKDWEFSGNIILSSPNGNRYTLSVTDGGTLSVIEIV